MKILVTGAAGFVGRHAAEALRRWPGADVIELVRHSSEAELERGLAEADVILHLAGVNRPADPVEFETVNAGLTAQICARLEQLQRRPLLVLSSSAQALLDNPYGRSKRAAEETVLAWARRTKSPAALFRLQGIFGKWCRPNYNSVTATFCHNVARDLPLTISDPARELELIYIDDVTAALMAAVDRPPPHGVPEFREVQPVFRLTLGELADTIRSFRESRCSLVLPSFAPDLVRKLYATYLSYLEGAEFSYALTQRTDLRGSLAEFMKSQHFGQIFVSRTLPGITRGNHYHHTKTEKFLVVEGEAVIRFRPIAGPEIIEHRVSGREFRVVDIPPGYTHSIENVGPGEMVTLFWASEIFDPARPDTIALPVLPPATP